MAPAFVACGSAACRFWICAGREPHATRGVSSQPAFRGMRLCRVRLEKTARGGSPTLLRGEFLRSRLSWHAALPRAAGKNCAGREPHATRGTSGRRFPPASSAPVFTDFLSNFTKISPRKALKADFGPKIVDFEAFIGFFGPILPSSGDFWAVKRFGIRRGFSGNFTEIFSEYLLARALASWLCCHPSVGKGFPRGRFKKAVPRKTA